MLMTESIEVIELTLDELINNYSFAEDCFEGGSSVYQIRKLVGAKEGLELDSIKKCVSMLLSSNPEREFELGMVEAMFPFKDGMDRYRFNAGIRDLRDGGRLDITADLRIKHKEKAS